MKRGGAVGATTVVAFMIMISGCTAGAPPALVPTSTATPSTTSTDTSSPTTTAATKPASTQPSSPPTASSTTAVPPAATVQRNPRWALDRIDQRRLPFDRRYHSRGQGQGVTVYVVDGIFDVSNAEFGGRASVGLALGQHCVLEDGIDHGLFVAGLVAGRRTGVAKQAKVVSVGSSYACEGGASATEKQRVARIVTALDWVTQHARKPAVVNLSLNADRNEPPITAAVNRLVSAGLTVVASAGNGGENACGHVPAGLPSVITVTGSTKSDHDAGLNYGRCVDLYAPASGVTSVVGEQISPNLIAISDQAATSWAAPLASGVAALYLSTHPSAAPQQVRTWMIDNATTGAIRGQRHGTPNRLLYSLGPR